MPRQNYVTWVSQEPTGQLLFWNAARQLFVCFKECDEYPDLDYTDVPAPGGGLWQKTSVALDLSARKRMQFMRTKGLV